MLSILELTKHFGTHTAVADFSLSIKESEFVTLLGPSGSGKTTVLRMIAGLLAPSEGHIHIGDLDVTNLNPQARNIGLVFQSYALFPNMTAWENIAFPLKVRHWKAAEIRKRVDDLLEMVGLSHRAKFFPEQLSGGERQRTALARALAFHPPLLLLDEPLSALDAKVRQGLRASLKEIQRTTGVTTLMVTHDQEEALELSDRIVVMNQGKIEQIGTSDDIYYRPQTSFTANFIGVVNSIPAVVQELRCGEAILNFQGIEFYWPTITTNWVQGETIILYVRPESIEVSIQQQGGYVPATVTASVFAGTITHVTLKLGDQTLLADVLSSQARAFSPGTFVFVRIVPPVDVHSAS